MKYWLGCLGCICAMSISVASEPSLEATLAQDSPGKLALQKAQDRVNQRKEVAARLSAQTLQQERENRLLAHYKRRLEKQIVQLKEQQVAIANDRAQLRTFRVHLYPKMLRMQETLEKMVAADLPFYDEERRLRLTHLKEVMQDATLTEAQKLDFLLDAYQVEVSYGYTVSGHEGTNEKGDLVTYLRVGRLAYIAIDATGQNAQYFAQGAWHPYQGNMDALRAAVEVAQAKKPWGLMRLDRSIFVKRMAQ